MPRNFVFAFFFLFILADSACKSDPPNSVSKEPSSFSSTEQKIDSLLAVMTLDEKIGQMTQVGKDYLETEGDIKTYHLGSLLSGGGMAPSSNTPAAWADMYDGYQRQALQTRLKIPLLYGIDAVHGHNNVRGAVIFPHNIGMGCTRNAALVEDAARITGIEVAATGIDWTFSPCVTVPQDERWGRTYEGFGENTSLVSEMTAAEVRGYQKNIIACAKHFVGDGGTQNGINAGDTRIDELTLRAIHLPPYQAAINAGVGTVMASYSAWNGVRMHGNRYLLTTVLKDNLNFRGFVVSDWSGIDNIAGSYLLDIEMAVNAGVDMVMVPQRYKEFIADVKLLVQDGRVSMSRIDDAVRRILRVKFEYGLFEHPFTDRALLPSVGSAEHRAVARDCVRQSVVMLKNDNGLLPLSKSVRRIVVSGVHANDLGLQCGGWTISWQGESGATTVGTTILEAIRKAVSDSTVVTFSPDGSGAAGADVGIAVVGESSYAEGGGDRTDLSLPSQDVAAIGRLKGAGIPVVTILISGRPIIVTTEISTSNAFLAAWLPGTEGDGVADILFGSYAPTGKLSHSWPRTMSQIPVNAGDVPYDPLFPYGFGLTY